MGIGDRLEKKQQKLATLKLSCNELTARFESLSQKLDMYGFFLSL